MSDPFKPRKAWLLHEELGIIAEVKNIQLDVQYDMPDELNLMEEIGWDFQQTPVAGSMYLNLHPSLLPSRNPQWSLWHPSRLYLPPSVSSNPSPSAPVNFAQVVAALFQPGMFGFSFAEKATPPKPQEIHKLDNPVIGYRAWFVSQDPLGNASGGPRLCSIGGSYAFSDKWTPRGATEAYCRLHPAARAYIHYDSVVSGEWMHEIPGWYCQCGLYVLNHLDKAPRWLHNSALPHVFGAVLGWGNVIEHGDEGWRAQYARPIALLGADASQKLWFPYGEQYWHGNEAIQEVAEVYGIPVIQDARYLVHYAKEFGQSTQEGT